MCRIFVKRTYLRVCWRSTIDLCLMNLPRRSTFKGVLKVYTLSKILLWIKLGGPATAFDLAAFRLSMIAPIKKSVNHSRTVVSMRETGWEEEVCRHCEIRFRSCWSLISLLWPIFFRGNVELTFPFLLVLRLSLHAVYHAKNETSERSLYIFLDARPFGSLQAFKMCFCVEYPQD